MSEKWDKRFLGLAEHISQWSRDPSTKVGAVIVDSDQRIISVGFNGFARGVEDYPERYADRETKYMLTVHGEINAILFAARDRLEGATLYTWPFMPCVRCASMVVQAGISRVIAPSATDDQLSRWAKEFDAASGVFSEAGVELIIYPMEELHGGR